MRHLLILLFSLVFLPSLVAAQQLTVEEREALGLEESKPGTIFTTNQGTFSLGGSDVLLVPESSNDAVMILDATTGDLINASFVVDPDNLSTPINAIADLDGLGILVCDQLEDAVLRYDADGVFETLFAPAGGPDTNILDNVRGCAESGGALHVTTAGGANADAVASFDGSGTYTGNLIANLAGGMDSPFDVLFRGGGNAQSGGDILVAAIDSDGIYRYNLGGTFIEIFATVDTFPEQLHETASGNILVANFSGSQEGIIEYLADGTFVGVYDWAALGGYRGVYELPSGNLLVTNGGGVHEVQRNGTVVRTIVDGVSGRFIERVPASVVPVEFGSFDATTSGRNVHLVWTTHSETNNAGFEVQMARVEDGEFHSIAFVDGHGTTTEAQTYATDVRDLDPGSYYFRLKQVDFDGAFMVTAAVEATITVPGTHYLSSAYPNPFNPQSQFSLVAPVDQNVTAELYNALGQRVVTLFEGSISANQAQTITIDGAGLPSGMYLVRVTGEHFTDAMQVTLVK